MIAAIVIGFYILCSAVGFGIYAYRNTGDAEQVVGLIFMAPLGLAYQCGALVRETRQGR